MKVEGAIFWAAPCDFRIGAPGAHIARNAVGALLAVALVDGDVLNAAAALAEFHRAQGPRRAFRSDDRGRSVRRDRRKLQRQSRLDGGGAGASWQRATAQRRIAVLGDMLEMGPEGAEPACGVSPARSKTARADLVFAKRRADGGAVGEHCPPRAAAPMARTSADIARRARRRRCSDGDAVLVKGSLGSRMAVIIEALKARGRGTDVSLFSRAVVRPCRRSERLPLHHVPLRRRGRHCAAHRFHGRPAHDPLAARCGRARASPSAPMVRSATSSKSRARRRWAACIILVPSVVATLLWADLTDPYVWIVLFVTVSFGLLGFRRRLSEGDQALVGRRSRAA